MDEGFETMIKERKALPLIDAGNWQAAIESLRDIWASFPGNNYGQGGRSMGARNGPDSSGRTSAFEVSTCRMGWVA